MKLSIVIPMYNEEDTIPHLKNRFNQLFHDWSFDYELILVDDGSRDRGPELVQQWIKENHHVMLIKLSRNFGHQQAITAGLCESNGDCVVIMDADLQDPPEEIQRMVEKWQEGYKIVFADRKTRQDGFLRKILFHLFYKIFIFFSELPIVINSGVFGLMDRVVVNHLLNMTERNRFIPGMRGWIGFETTTIYYERQKRVGGEPKQNLKRLISYALNAIFSFSYKPLRASFLIGMGTTIFFSIYGIVLVVMRLLNINVVRGFTTPSVAIFFIGGLMLISNGIMGEYIARIYDEVKRRPIYIASKKTYREADSDLIETDLNDAYYP
ncbi:MAG: glycosyltransferase family 2 protein [Candidatus Omnitrophica bacterium]|nr:glycosyltransferase family 2 protein [Candidatus Omnitrophota bacterium]